MGFFWFRKKKAPEKPMEATPSKPKSPTAAIETSKGRIEFELFTDKAPMTSANFTKLVQRNFYDGLTFHRVVPGFVVQCGCPKGDGTGGSGATIQLEIHPDLKHDAAGVVAMARTSNPNSASSQFYITLGVRPSLDGQYAVFGRVTRGMDVVSRINKGDRIQSIRIV